MGLMKYIVQGFGWRLGSEAAERGLRVAEEKADALLEHGEQRLQEEQTKRKLQQEEARRMQAEAELKRQAMKKTAQSELRKMKQELGLLPPDPWWVRFLRAIRLYRD